MVFKGENFLFLHIKPYNKDMYDYIECYSNILTWLQHLTVYKTVNYCGFHSIQGQCHVKHVWIVRCVVFTFVILSKYHDIHSVPTPFCLIF